MSIELYVPVRLTKTYMNVITEIKTTKETKIEDRDVSNILENVWLKQKNKKYTMYLKMRTLLNDVAMMLPSNEKKIETFLYGLCISRTWQHSYRCWFRLPLVWPLTRQF